MTYDKIDEFKYQDWSQISSGFIYSNEDFMFYIRTGINKPQLRKAISIEDGNVTYRIADYNRETGRFTLNETRSTCKEKTFKKWAKWIVVWTM